MELDPVFENIYKKGIYYNPAYLHYKKVCHVTCDKCKTTELSICIGLDDNDLCLNCIMEIDKTHSLIKKKSE